MRYLSEVISCSTELMFQLIEPFLDCAPFEWFAASGVAISCSWRVENAFQRADAVSVLFECTLWQKMADFLNLHVFLVENLCRCASNRLTDFNSTTLFDWNYRWIVDTIIQIWTIKYQLDLPTFDSTQQHLYMLSQKNQIILAHTLYYTNTNILWSPKSTKLNNC